MAEKAVQVRAPQLPELLTTMLKGLMPSIPHLLPPDISTEQFRSALWLELTSKPALRECAVASIRECAVKAATYGALPGRDCHFLPFKKAATFVENYFGMIRALERTGKIKKAFAHPVYEGDQFETDYLTQVFRHIPALSIGHPQGKVRFYYGAVLLKDDTLCLELVSLEQIDAVRRRSPAHDSGPWVTDFDMMARKTALKRCAKYVQLTPEQHTLLADDDARELTDIPPARHAQNLLDVYGVEPPATAASATPPPGVDPETGVLLSEEREADEPPLFGWPDEQPAASAVQT